MVGTRELDGLLSDKDGVARQLEGTLRAEAAAFGLEVKAVGIRDVILPGDMKEILNRVTEARKAAEANLVTRREETAAIRSQANTARIFESNPTLMRLRELEVLEKVAEKANLSVVLGDGGLAEKVTKLLEVQIAAAPRGAAISSPRVRARAESAAEPEAGGYSVKTATSGISRPGSSGLSSRRLRGAESNIGRPYPVSPDGRPSPSPPRDRPANTPARRRARRGRA